LFTRAHHWSLSWSRCIQSTFSHPVSLRSIVTQLRPDNIKMNIRKPDSEVRRCI
jgi:hypothetical protein